MYQPSAEAMVSYPVALAGLKNNTTINPPKLLDFMCVVCGSATVNNKTRQGNSGREDTTRYDKVGQFKTIRDKTRQSQTRRMTRPNETRRYEARNGDHPD